MEYIKLKQINYFLFFFLFSTILYTQTNIDSLNIVVNQNHIEGMKLLELGKKKEGLEKLNNAIRVFREIDYELSDKRDSIKKVIEEDLKVNPKSPYLNCIMGNMLYLTKRDSIGMVLAKEYFNKSISLEPNFIPPYLGLASLAQFQNDNEIAISQFRKVLEIDSTYYSAYLRFASLLNRIGNKIEAETLLQKIILNDTSSNNKVRAAINLASNKNNFEDKKKLYESALTYAIEQSDSILVFSNLMYLYLEEKEKDFLEFANELLSSKIGNVRELRVNVLYNYFNYLTKNDKSKILSFAEKTIDEKHPLLLLMAGNYFYKEEKDYETALKFLLKAYEITDNETVYHTILHGKRDEKMLMTIADEYKNFIISSSIGKVYLELKKYNLAEKYLSSAVQFAESKRNSEALVLLSKVKEEKGEFKEAANLIIKALAIKDNNEQRNKLEELNLKIGQTIKTSDLIKEEREKNAVMAKDFTLKSLDGTIFKLSENRGKVVILDFWATWCGPCVSMLPQLIQLFDKYSDNKNVVFQSIDVNESEKTIKDFLKKKGYSFNILIANGTTVPKDYDITVIPTMFIIDKNGKIQFKHIGFDSKENIIDSLSKEIDELLLVE